MARILDLALAALLAAAPVAVHAQTTAEPSAPVPEDEPNWPAGVGNWDTPPRDPEGGNPDAAEDLGLTSEEVVETLDTQPTEQGLRGTQVIGDPDEAESRGLTDESVEETVDQEPTQQGNRPENVVEGEEEIAPQEASLYERLARVRAAPPGLDGEPIPRPNALASEPTTEMDPLQPENPSLFVEGYVE
jgi:hypothetical protein